MAITIRQISYETDFYWKGERYKQVIRMKDPKSKAKIICRKARDPCSDYVEMPPGRVIKPVIRIKNG